jgi:hypothetical protein
VLWLTTIAFKLSDVPGGVRSIESDVGMLADGVRLCLVRYEAERGSAGRAVALGEPPFVDVVPWKDDRRLASGDEGAEVAGERWDGGV